MRALAFLFACTFAVPALGATFTVNNTADVADASPGDGVCETVKGNGICTLRAAVQEAGALTGAQTIVIPAGTYTLSLTPVCAYSQVSNHNVLNQNMSALCVKGNVTISGAGAASTIIDAGGANGATCCGGYPSARAMLIDFPATAQISGITLQHGLGAGGFDAFGGGAINNQGNLTVTNCTFTANNGVPGGGGIWNDGTLLVQNSLFTANTSGSYGGSGIYNSGSGPATISNSTFSYNNSNTNGGAIYSSGIVKISNSAIYQNIAGSLGGGIFASNATTTLTNVTISSNQSVSAGGIYSGNGSQVIANNVTIASNHASNTAGGIYNVTAVTFGNSILANNTDAGDSLDCGGAVISTGHNLMRKVSSFCRFTGATNDIFGVDPNLGPIADNGGPSFTQALLPGSPAIDAGDPAAPGSGGTACAADDQRGYLRPVGARCDIGAFEQNTSLTLTSVTPSHAANTGPVELTVLGSGFVSGMAVKLRRAGQSDITGSPVTVSGGGASLTAVFDLTSQAPGAWDVAVTNPSNVTITLPAAFTVDSGGASNLYFQVVSPSAIRSNSTATFFLLYGNRGNADALDVPLTLDVPSNIPLTISFPVSAPPAQAGQVVSDWSHAPLYVGSPQAVVNVPLLLPIIPAGSVNVLKFELFFDSSWTHGQIFEFLAENDAPYFNPMLDTSVVSQMTANAIQYAQTNLGVTVSPSRTDAVTAYVINQLQLAAAAGRAAYATSLGAQPLIFSPAEFLIDAAEYAAFGGSTNISSHIRTGLKPQAGGGSSGGGNCSGGVMTPGSSCGTGNDGKIPDPGDPDKPFTPADCRSIPNHSVSSDGKTCHPTDKRDCPLIQNPFTTDPNCLTFPIRGAIDPNGKSGPAGAGSQNYLTSVPPFTYLVEYQNQPTADLPAQTVVVTDQLDTSTLDPATFSFGNIFIANYLLTPPAGSQQFSAGLDLRPTLNVAVKVDASLNTSTGLVTWRFTTLDPITLQPTTDPTAGFLPPDVTPPQGEGKMLYNIQPRSSVGTGATICNQATVVFDSNAPITTPAWCNTIDTVAPTSKVSSLPASTTSTNFTVQWSGSDATSGIDAYTVYASDNGGPFTPWLSNTALTQSTYSGVSGHTYAFYSIAEDNAGNTEGPKSTAEATIAVNSSGSCATDVTSQFSIVLGGYRYNNATARFVQTVTVTNSSGATLPGPFALATENLSSNASLYSPAGTTSCIAPGSSYLTLNGGATTWSAGQSVTVTLEFIDPTRAAFTYKAAILAGASR